MCPQARARPTAWASTTKRTQEVLNLLAFTGTKVQILTQKVESGDSRFLLFWLPHTKTVYEEKVKVTVGGYMFRQQVVK
jgi:hypothetical protein